MLRYCLFIMCVLAASARADIDGGLVEVAATPDITYVRAGVGSHKQSDYLQTAQYIRVYQSDDEIARGSDHFGEHKALVAGIGVAGFGYLADNPEKGGAEFAFELTHSQIDDLDYDRTGFGIRLALWLPIYAGLQANLGATVRPYFLSTDWHDDADLEYEYTIGIEYAVHKMISVYAHQHQFALVDNDKKVTQVAEGALAGVRIKF
ncbi:MAG: hypothetical protein H7A08_09655 [Oceanospirillaceae bacterium]|nr:hypothetical protein [Oceanospirillaceae bacterium]MCP5350870.1 hypothetical protein [Oceanospirillaceae bacterium]